MKKNSWIITSDLPLEQFETNIIGCYSKSKLKLKVKFVHTLPYCNDHGENFELPEQIGSSYYYYVSFNNNTTKSSIAFFTGYVAMSLEAFRTSYSLNNDFPKLVLNSENTQAEAAQQQQKIIDLTKTILDLNEDKAKLKEEILILKSKISNMGTDHTPLFCSRNVETALGSRNWEDRISKVESKLNIIEEEIFSSRKEEREYGLKSKKVKTELSEDTNYEKMVSPPNKEVLVSSASEIVEKYLKGIDNFDLYHQWGNFQGSTYYVGIDCKTNPFQDRMNKRESFVIRCSVVNYFGHVLFDQFMDPAKSKSGWDFEFSEHAFKLHQTTQETVSLNASPKKFKERLEHLLDGKILVGYSLDKHLMALHETGFDIRCKLTRDISEFDCYRKNIDDQGRYVKVELETICQKNNIKSPHQDPVKTARAAIMLYILDLSKCK